MPVAVTFGKIDASSLNKAVAMGLQVTRQEPRALVLNSAKAIVYRALELTPYVEISTIDSEMGIISEPVLSTRGNRKGLPLKSGRKKITVPADSMAVSIVLARLNPTSKYNLRTRQRWALDKASFSPGGGESGFWSAVKATAQRMVLAKHSSTHFLQAGWATAYRRLKMMGNGPAPLTASIEDVESGVIDVEAIVERGESQDFGDAKIKGTGTGVSLDAENLVGLRGVNAEDYNKALLEHGTGPLQQAVNERAAELEARYLPRWEAALARRWNAIP